MPPWRHTSVAPHSTASTTPLDLLDVEQIGIAAQVERERPLRERAEATLERADIRVVDVAVPHEGDGIADRLDSELVGDRGDMEEVGPARAEERHDLVDAHFFSREGALEHLADRRARASGPAGRQCHGEKLRRMHVAAGRPLVIARETFEIRCALHREANVGVEPLLGSAHVLGVDGEARGEGLARRLGGRAQDIQRGPRALRVHVIGGDRGDAAPVVDAGGNQRGELVGIGEVRWCLQMDIRRQQHPRRGNGPEVLVGVARGGARHRGTRLGQEVLDDDLLHVAVTLVRGGDRLQCFDPLGAVLADADEDAGGEGDLRESGGLEGGEAAFGGLVGSARMGPAGFGESCRERLDHHPLRG